MKPIKFKHQNTTFAENQPEYENLPALKIDSPQGEVISCWGLTFKERIRVLFTGKMWVSLMSFNKPLTPNYLSTKRKDVFVCSSEGIEKIVKKNLRLFFKLRKQTMAELNN